MKTPYCRQCKTTDPDSFYPSKRSLCRQCASRQRQAWRKSIPKRSTPLQTRIQNYVEMRLKFHYPMPLEDELATLLHIAVPTARWYLVKLGYTHP